MISKETSSHTYDFKVGESVSSKTPLLSYDSGRKHVGLILLCGQPRAYACVAVRCCSVLQCVAARCCSVLQCAAVCCHEPSGWPLGDALLQRVEVCCSVLQCVPVCCSVLQCVAVCCSVLQCIVVLDDMFNK